MDESVRRALGRGGVIDITTRGRRSGQPRRIEIVFHVIDGRIFISGRPSRRTRAWIHNLSADPNLVIHLKGPIAVADVPAVARVVSDRAERERILPRVARNFGNPAAAAVMIEASPLIEVTVPGLGRPPEPNAGAAHSGTGGTSGSAANSA